MDVRELTDEAERRRAVPIVRQLWGDADPESVIAWTAEDDYHLFGGFVDSELVGVAGVLLSRHLHHVRHAWLYDLVVDEPERENGYGTALLEFVERWAEENGCEYVALASPLAKHDVHEFYENRAFDRWGYVIEKRL
ncbi:GNAT family N-acetyltransferase [Halobellus sp. GM3]|uniref:GNAT family N-acetyltransferase n=1 Tax=Halobellus sp. GM3 TaxID=3458410 RepID=UPI00403DD7C0